MELTAVDHSDFILSRITFWFLAMLCVLVLASLAVHLLFGRKARLRREAGRIYRRIQGMEAGEVYSTLRAMDPFAFELLVIRALKAKSGVRAWHGRNFSHDGGIDGKARIDGRLYYIQDKRYSKSIDPKHVEAFNAICRRDNVYGLFVHTGRTGDASRRANNANRVTIVGGRQLLSLLDSSSRTLDGLLM